jgi:KUP system potassium uptake protein
MLLTTLFMYYVAHLIWKWSFFKSLTVTGALAAVDLVFVSTNLSKVAEGGWFPLVAGAMILLMMTTWQRGRKIIFDHSRAADLQLVEFVNSLFRSNERQLRVPGTAVFMNRNADAVPSSFLHNLKHNKIVHDVNIFMAITTQKVPFADAATKYVVTDLGHGCFLVNARLGFKETPHVPRLLKEVSGQIHGWEYHVMDTSFFLTRQTIVATGKKGNMPVWREKLFAIMSRNAAKAADYFCIPPNRVVEIGTQINI